MVRSRLAVFAGVMAMAVAIVGYSAIRTSPSEAAEPVSIAISDPSGPVGEGRVATFRVTATGDLPAPGADPVRVDYTTLDGTAVGGPTGDYTTETDTLLFDSSDREHPVTIQTNEDVTDEPNETFFVDLSKPSGQTYEISRARGEAVIADDDGPDPVLISVDDPDPKEEGDTTIDFAVSLSEASTGSVSVDYETDPPSDPTLARADEPADYTETRGRLTFAPGETQRTVSVPIKEDATDERNESFVLELVDRPGDNALVGDSSGVGTIVDDDGSPELAVSDANVLEPDAASATVMRFRLTLSQPSQQTVTVAYATRDGAAKAPLDYMSRSGSGATALSIPAGETAANIDVTVNGDNNAETDEDMFLDLTTVTNANVSDPTGRGVILNEDGVFPAKFSVEPPAANTNEPGSGTATMTFPVKLSQALTESVKVTVETMNGSANGGSDFQTKEEEITFNIGETSKNFVVTINPDTTDEPDETVIARIKSASGANIDESKRQASGTIVDNDGPPTMSVNDPSGPEGTGGTSNLPFQVSLSAASGFDVVVHFATSAGTATTPNDFQDVDQDVTIPRGETSVAVPVPLVPDNNDEPNETLTATLSSPENATIADGTGTGTITDDDDPRNLTIEDQAVEEGDAGTVNAGFKITLTPAHTEQVTVAFATADGSATAPADYTAANGTVTFVAGDTEETISVPVKGDTLDEPNETFVVNLSSPTNASISDGQGIGTINDNNDPQAAASIADKSVNEGNSGTVDAEFAVTLSPASGHTVTIDYATTNGTAAAGSDYIAKTGTLTFTPGDTEETVTVSVAGDELDEPNETFTVTLSNAANAALTDATATGTITDDDLPWAITTGAGAGGGPHVRNLNGVSPFTERSGFIAGSSGGGTRVARGDVDGDGTDEIIVATGPGENPNLVRVYSPGGALQTSFAPYGNGFGAGVFVAAGDVDDDGNDEIITGAGPGGGPHVRVFGGTGSDGAPAGGGFFAYDPRVTFGVQVAAGDLDGDGRAEIVTGPGPGGGPHVRVLTPTGQPAPGGVDFMAYGPGFVGGVNVAVAQSPDAETPGGIITAPFQGDGPVRDEVRGFGFGSATALFSFHPYDGNANGLSIAYDDSDGDILTGAGQGGGPHVRLIGVDHTGGEFAFVDKGGFMAYVLNFRGGVWVAAGLG